MIYRLELNFEFYSLLFMAGKDGAMGNYMFTYEGIECYCICLAGAQKVWDVPLPIHNNNTMSLACNISDSSSLNSLIVINACWASREPKGCRPWPSPAYRVSDWP